MAIPQPSRTVYCDLTITRISVALALLVGTIEISEANLSLPFWGSVLELNGGLRRRRPVRRDLARGRRSPSAAAREDGAAFLAETNRSTNR
jgi:hypothetical protein